MSNQSKMVQENVANIVEILCQVMSQEEERVKQAAPKVPQIYDWRKDPARIARLKTWERDELKPDYVEKRVDLVGPVMDFIPSIKIRPGYRK